MEPQFLYHFILTRIPLQQPGKQDQLAHCTMNLPNQQGPSNDLQANFSLTNPIFHPSQTLSLEETEPLLTAKQHLSRQSGQWLKEYLTYFFRLVLRPPTDTGDSHSCTSISASGGHRCGNQEKNQQDPDASQDGISCPCIKVCVSYAYCEKFSKDFGYICLSPSHNKMTPLERGLHLGYSICIKTHHKKTFVNPVDRMPG